jgi:hypothetical protein
MKSGRIAGWTVAPAAVSVGLAGCGGSSSGAGAAAAGSSAAASQPASPSPTAPATQPAGSSQSSQSGVLTAPGTARGFGQQATVVWVPPSVDLGEGKKTGFRFKVSVQSIKKGTIGDFKNIELDAGQKKSTSQGRIKALGKAAGH